MAWLNAAPTPETPSSGKQPPPERPRREDIERHFGRVLMPSVPGGDYLLNCFFKMGPAGPEGPLCIREVQKWAPVLAGMREWKPWQAELFVRLSREYCAAQHEASKYYAPPPWSGAVRMWDYVRAKEIASRAQAMLKQEIPRNGDRK